MGMKVKTVCCDNQQDFDEKINLFIKDKSIMAIDFSTSTCWDDYNDSISFTFCAMISYMEA
jgi:hypothetical protein